ASRWPSVFRRRLVAGIAGELLEARRNDRPGRTAAREDRDGRLEQRRVIERAGVDRERVGDADLTAEHQTAADGAEVACRVAVGGFRHELTRLAAEAHRAACKSQERDESRARCLLAIEAVAMSRIEGLAFGLIAQRAAQT